MKLTTKDHTTIIVDTEGDIVKFFEKVNHQFESFKGQNLILDISKDQSINSKSIMIFHELSKNHIKSKKSFVLVVPNIDFNKVPASITVVPSIIEAHDMVEMDEIERDLGF